MGHRRREGRRLAALVVVLLGSQALAQQQEVPADLQAAILTRTLAYDRALKARAGASVVVGILARAKDNGSLAVQGRMLHAFEQVQPRAVQGVPLEAVTALFEDRAALLAWIDARGIDALYLAPGLEDELPAIRRVCAERKLVSMTGSRSAVQNGVAVGVITRGDSAGLLVNLAAAAAAGMDLDPKLLKLSEVLR